MRVALANRMSVGTITKAALRLDVKPDPNHPNAVEARRIFKAQQTQTKSDEQVIAALVEHRGSVTRAARSIGLARETVYKRLWSFRDKPHKHHLKAELERRLAEARAEENP